MGRLTIRLVKHPETGKREVAVAFESDADALPMEHEQEHRRLVEQLVGSLREGNLVVERAGDGATTEVAAPTPALAVPEKIRQ